ncbi:DUF2569 family protein [Rhodocytophaga aerolata]|uniref:DUF2569 family protein n=1 Tax=Rhodocytophaga aerolata TaxID=455078 RepID=A0ABT8RIT6_9BACT|nr:DUF2569 family protein [Rhodocytophaga aerolata]MDO1452009.1 DUF2569 family protein [Rhodocytophaga aerolata]
MPASSTTDQITENSQPTKGYGAWLLLMMGYMLLIAFYILDRFMEGRLTDGSLLNIFTGEVSASRSLSGPIGITRLYAYTNPLANPIFFYMQFMLITVTFFNFWKRKRNTPKWMIAFFVISIIYAIGEVIGIANSPSFDDFNRSMMQQNAIHKLVVSCLFFIPAILYLIRSKKVKEVFVN